MGVLSNLKPLSIMLKPVQLTNLFKHLIQQKKVRLLSWFPVRNVEENSCPPELKNMRMLVKISKEQTKCNLLVFKNKNKNHNNNNNKSHPHHSQNNKLSKKFRKRSNFQKLLQLGLIIVY